MTDFHTEVIRTAKKEHRCYLCGDPIPKGEKYVRASGSYCGDFYSAAEHPVCAAYMADIYEPDDMISEGEILEAAHNEAEQGADESRREFVARAYEVYKERRHQAAMRRKVQA